MRFYSLLQTVVCAVLFLGTLMPYVQYLMFSQALTADLQDKVARLTRERDEERRKLRHIEEDAHAAEERADALDKHAGEHENQHRALEHMVQRLQKKLDVCTNDRGVLSGELGTATRKAAGATHLELLNRQCESDKEDAVALQMELKREMEQMEEELEEAKEEREMAEKREAQQRALAARIKGALVAMRKEESMAGKAMASAFSAAALAEIGEMVDKKKTKRKRKKTMKKGEEEEVDEEEEEEEEDSREDEEEEVSDDGGGEPERRKRDAFGRVLPGKEPAAGMIRSRKERSDGSGGGFGRPGSRAGGVAGESAKNVPSASHPTAAAARAPPRNMTRLEKAAARVERRRSHPEVDDYDYRDPPPSSGAASAGDDDAKEATDGSTGGDSSGGRGGGTRRGRGHGGGGTSRKKKNKERAGAGDDDEGGAQDNDVDKGGNDGKVKWVQDRDLIHRLDTAGVKALPLQTRLLSKRNQYPNAGNQPDGGGGEGSLGVANAALARAARASRDRET